ncbi:MAG: MucB/RseB C-terminal domain-containing protein [Gallionella sp.]
MRIIVAILRLFLGASLLIATHAHAGENRDGFDWLKVVILAERQTEYSGVFIYQYDSNVESSKISHVIVGDDYFERLESLDGPRREIVRHHGQVWSHIGDGHEMVQVDSQQGMGKFSSLSGAQLHTLYMNYQAKVLGVDRVAGYDAQIIKFQPRDNLRYTYKIWVHKDSGLLLKSAVLGSKNQLVEQYSFTQLQIGGKIDRSWVKKSAATGHRGPKFHEQHNVSRLGIPVKSGWKSDAMPSGFRKTMEIERPMHGNHEPVTQIVYSDGLSAISIFIELDDNDEDDVEGLSSRGAVSLYHKVVGKHLYTVVGEVPPHTVMRVLDSIRHKGM